MNQDKESVKTMSNNPTAAQKRMWGSLDKEPKRLVLSPKKYNELKMYVYERDEGCVVCKAESEAGMPVTGDGLRQTAHHVKKRSAGGNDSPNNLVWVCGKHHDEIEQYKIFLSESVIKMLEGEPESLY